jgi:hypothetical protein
MNHLLRGLVGLIIGAVCGAVVGAIILALPLSPENNCDALFGCQADWKLLGVYLGSMFGGVAGGVIGLIVGIASSSRLKSMGIGALTALLLAIEFFGVDGFIDEQVGPIAILLNSRRGHGWINSKRSSMISMKFSQPWSTRSM